MLYVGDQVSFEVVSPPGLDVKDANVRVQVDPPEGSNLGPVNFGPWGIQGRYEATMLWSWDTQNLGSGSHTLSFDVQPQGYKWTRTGHTPTIQHNAASPGSCALGFNPNPMLHRFLYHQHGFGTRPDRH